MNRSTDGLPRMGEDYETQLENLMDNNQPPEHRLARLPKGQEPMSEEKWGTHVDCEKSNRSHRWQWRWDIAAGTSSNQAICVHCGKEAVIDRDGAHDV